MFLTFGCKKETSAPDSGSGTLFAKGKAVYFSKCIACHHADPSKAGSLGPEVRGASLDLLRAKLLDGTYPPGYTPKRGTTLMPKQPELANDLEALHVFLQGESS